MKIKPRPALYFLIPYLLGIIVGKWASIPFLWLWLAILFSFIGSILTRNRRRYLSYGLLHVAIFAGGMLRLEIATDSPIPVHFYDEPVSFSGTTAYQPERGKAWDACYAVGELRLLSNPSERVTAKFLIRFQELMPLRYGKHITLTGVLREPQGRRNPGGFDYKAYLARQNIVGIVDAKGLLRIGEQGGFLPLRWIEALRIRTERVMDLIYTTEAETKTQRSEPTLHAQLLKGILLGKRSDIPSETLDVFRNSGTFHVLSVSGLHVGLIAMFCYIAFSIFRCPQKVRCLLTIIAILVYACLIGFRPSVFRATLMAILFLYAKLIDRDADLFNLLSFAALVLLLLNPQQLWDVGFQLSFVAVAAIVYFVPKMEKPLRRFWEPADNTPSGTDVSILTQFRNIAVKWLAPLLLRDARSANWNDSIDSVLLLPIISVGYRCRSVRSFAGVDYCCCGYGVGMFRFRLASAGEAACITQSRYYFHLFGTHRSVWTGVGSGETNTTDIRCIRPLYLSLLRHRSLAAHL